jgi:hypothetical protein
MSVIHRLVSSGTLTLSNISIWMVGQNFKDTIEHPVFNTVAAIIGGCLTGSLIKDHLPRHRYTVVTGSIFALAGGIAGVKVLTSKQECLE